MYKISKNIITLIIISFLFSQSNHFYLWNGLSVSNSDNLDAINLNPAGLGFKRAEQLGFALKQFPHDSEDINFIALAKRYKGGFAMETSYYESGHHQKVHPGIYLNQVCPAVRNDHLYIYLFS